MEKMCLLHISIQTNFDQNCSLNKCARNILAKKLSYMTSDDL